MPESSSNQFTETPKATGCRDRLVAHYGKIGSSALLAALCVSSKPTMGKEMGSFDDAAGAVPAILRDEDSAD